MNRCLFFQGPIGRWPVPCIAATLLLGVASAGTAHAFNIETGHPDLRLRWDNTLRLNYIHRVEGQDEHLLQQVNADDGNRNFDTGMVSARVDLLSELDFAYKRYHGFRISAAAWYDYAYDRSLDNDSPSTSNHMVDGMPGIGLSDAARRYYRGVSGELLDAFGFTRVNLGGTTADLRLGRHVVYWGESLLGNGVVHGITYGQSGLDLAKSAAIPGTEAKELFRPLNQFSAQWRPSDTLSLAAQYFLQWEPFRIPEAGTFLGTNDVLLEGGESLIAAGGARFLRGPDIEPKNRGEWGVSARWTPDWLGNRTLGFYYRNFADKLPQAFLFPSTGTYHLAYGDDIDLYGVSLAQQIGGLSVGTELSYRRNMPLVSDIAVLTQLPARGEVPGARGDTWHALINVIGIRPGNVLWDALNWSSELTLSRVQKVTVNEALYKGRDDYAGGIDKPTRNYVGVALNLAPTYYQVANGVDLFVPISVSYGLHGNAGVTSGGNKDAGSYAIGIGLDVLSRYRFDLRYTDYFGREAINAAGARVYNGTNALLHDRGNVSLTFKTTF